MARKEQCYLLMANKEFSLNLDSTLDN
uniref:Uncharacterized protein n=1 Tax=Arundo donax TaxID=35708 RepID=A0A0A8ZUA1_ARUDO